MFTSSSLLFQRTLCHYASPSSTSLLLPQVIRHSSPYNYVDCVMLPEAPNLSISTFSIILPNNCLYNMLILSPNFQYFSVYLQYFASEISTNTEESVGLEALCFLHSKTQSIKCWHSGNSQYTMQSVKPSLHFRFDYSVILGYPNPFRNSNV